MSRYIIRNEARKVVVHLRLTISALRLRTSPGFASTLPRMIVANSQLT
ncbi:MAG: hypothetical protein IPJ07_09480 [Acidobacteria bacterium]|nr:hypothetical protein [Acidobacteriota bacterium]